jgi:peptidoglycan hydrolase FlgJ
MTPTSLLTGTSTDLRSVDAMRAGAARDPKAAVREAAKQFEALFMQQLLKSMRQASLGSGLLDNSGSQLGTEMLDTQFAAKMSGLPGGLSELIARHLERQLGSAAAQGEALDEDGLDPAAAGAQTPLARPAAGSLSGTQADFVRRHRAAAQAAQAESGIPASFMLAQAAHETGWGRQPIRHADGSSAHNFFGIKAGANWAGPVAEVATTEVIDGEPRKVKAKFRAYASDAESFRDYARLIRDTPRYRDAFAQAGATDAGAAERFARELQRAGYATDPLYAQKLTRTINTTLQLQRAVT